MQHVDAKRQRYLYTPNDEESPTHDGFAEAMAYSEDLVINDMSGNEDTQEDVCEYKPNVLSGTKVP